MTVLLRNGRKGRQLAEPLAVRVGIAERRVLGLAFLLQIAGDPVFLSAADGKLIRLTAKGDAWEDVGRLKQPRIVHRMVAANDNLLVAVGGAFRGDNVAVTEAIANK